MEGFCVSDKRTENRRNSRALGKHDSSVCSSRIVGRRQHTAKGGLTLRYLKMCCCGNQVHACATAITEWTKNHPHSRL